MSIATGFFWQYGDDLFLVTNYHVASGMDPETNQPLDRGGRTPDRLELSILDASGLASWKSLEIELCGSQQRPVWLEHPKYSSKVDVVAIPINPGESYRMLPINGLKYDEFRFEISQDVFIIGFPRGVTGSGRFPVFKRGSIATEPSINLDGVPKILIDSATREGRSGSPVIAQYTGYYSNEPGHMTSNDWFGTGRRFLGIYSGRNIDEDELAAKLGIVWKAPVIEEIIMGGVRPK